MTVMAQMKTKKNGDITMFNFQDLIHKDNNALLGANDINTILNCGEEYVTFHISVTNSGHCVQFTTDSEPMGLDEDWNGYDFAMTIDEFDRELWKHGAVRDRGYAYEFVAEWDKECFNDGYGGY